MVATAVLVDIDGVINAEAPVYWPTESWVNRTIYPKSLNDVFRVNWSRALVDELRDVTGLPGVEMVWLTTWTWRAPTDFAPAIGLGADWRYIDREEARAAQVDPDLDWWKADAARDALSAADRVVWIDDHITFWMDMLRATGVQGGLDWMDPARLLAVCPDGRRGMEPRHIADITHFILTGERPGP